MASNEGFIEGPETSAGGTALEDRRWLVLVNPDAGRGVSERGLRRVSGLLDSAGLRHDVMLSDSPTDLVDTASMAAGKGYGGIAAYGGDGTASRIAAGIIHSRASLVLTVIPGGNGNDWARTLGIRSADDTIDAMLRQDTVLLDAGECLVRDAGGSNIRSSLFINSAGTGLDAHVLRRALQLRRRYGLGRLGYISALMNAVREMPSWTGSLAVDGEESFEGPYLSMTTGICPFAGGGMMLSPSSVPSDGLLDTAVVRPLSRSVLVRSVPMLYRGTLLEHPSVSSWRGREHVIRSGGSTQLELDGETIPDLPEGAEIILRSLPSALLTLRGPRHDRMAGADRQRCRA